MEYRKIKENKTSLLGMGCMRLPLISGSDEIDYEHTKKMIDYAFNNGINYFDTAYPYHSGKSEIVIGDILSTYPRESFFLADKMPSWYLKTLDDAKRIFNEQLSKCKVYDNLYSSHGINKSQNTQLYI